MVGRLARRRHGAVGSSSEEDNVGRQWNALLCRIVVLRRCAELKKKAVIYREFDLIISESVSGSSGRDFSGELSGDYIQHG